jgi:predicted Holliday junction resolvase-like endonuclease
MEVMTLIIVILMAFTLNKVSKDVRDIKDKIEEDEEATE